MSARPGCGIPWRTPSSCPPSCAGCCRPALTSPSPAFCSPSPCWFTRSSDLPPLHLPLPQPPARAASAVPCAIPPSHSVLSTHVPFCLALLEPSRKKGGFAGRKALSPETHHFFIFMFPFMNSFISGNPGPTVYPFSVRLYVY